MRDRPPKQRGATIAANNLWPESPNLGPWGPPFRRTTVERKAGCCQVARKVCLLALFGLVALTLAGPILSLVVVILSFALLGLLVWLPIRLLIYGTDGAVRDGVEKGKAVARLCGRTAAATWHGTMGLGRHLRETLRGTASRVGAVLLETLSGAVVGALLVSTCWPQHAVTPGAVLLGGLTGGLAGVLVLVSRSRRPQKPSPSQVPQ
jgi:hypothetical protein